MTDARATALMPNGRRRKANLSIDTGVLDAIDCWAKENGVSRSKAIELFCHAYFARQMEQHVDKLVEHFRG